MPMPVAKTRTFKSGNSEALRLPRDLAFGGDVEVTMIRSGDVLTVFPSRGSIQDLVQRLSELPRPNAVEVRDDEPLPERPDL